ncbi:hypothetical protein ACCS44_30835 [Rhizobium ruizarguesonis]
MASVSSATGDRFAKRGLKSNRVPVNIALLVPILIYGILNYADPGQYRLILVRAIQNPPQFIIAVGIVLFYSVNTLLLLRAHGIHTVLRVILAASPLLLTFYAFDSVAGLGFLTTIVSILALAAFFAAYHWISTSKLRLAWLGGLLAFAMFAVFAIAHVYSPIDYARSVGSYAIFAVFVGFLSISGLAAAIYPKIGWATLGIIVVVYLATPNNHTISTVPSSSLKDDLITEWVSARGDLEAYKAANMPYPVIFVSSEGGGIYAAAHAYTTLSQLANGCPTFAQHIFVAVGVSGGAIGNALFNASIEDKQHDYAPCRPTDTEVNTSPLTEDHLAPVLARLLLVEMIARLLPGEWPEQDRASLLAESFKQASADPEYLSKAVGESWEPRSARPALAAVATKMNDGQRFVIAPFTPYFATGTGIGLGNPITTAEWYPGRISQTSVSLIEAAGISARFPWITPTARLELSPTSDRILADGGYFENSGADTVLDYIRGLRIWSDWEEDIQERGLPQECALLVVRDFYKSVDWSKCRAYIFPIHLAITSTSMNIKDREPAGSAQGRSSFLLDPITTLLTTRSSRGLLALERANTELCGWRDGECIGNQEASKGFFVSGISPTTLDLPLGWYLSESKVKSIAEAALPTNVFVYEGDDSDVEMTVFAFHVDTSVSGGDALPDP